jgi:hypothetical protein
MVLFILLFTSVVSAQEQTCAEFRQCFLCRPACLPCYLYQGFIFRLCNTPAVKTLCKIPFFPGCEACETQAEVCTQPGCDCSIIYHDCGEGPPDCFTTSTITSVSTTTTTSTTTSEPSRTHPTQVTTSNSDS